MHPFDLGPLIIGIIVMGVMIGIAVGVLVGFGILLGGILGVPGKLLVGENPISWMKPPKLQLPRRKRRDDWDDSTV